VCGPTQIKIISRVDEPGSGMRHVHCGPAMRWVVVRPSPAQGDASYPDKERTIMESLFDANKPRHGTCCPTCGLVVELPPKLRAGKDHPETAHGAAAVANKSLGARQQAIIAFLGRVGAAGATDDEIDAAIGWGHQCTTPVMHSLRKSRMVAWVFDSDGDPVKRNTRKGNPARVNVLAKYAIHGPKADDDHPDR